MIKPEAARVDRVVRELKEQHPEAQAGALENEYKAGFRDEQMTGPESQLPGYARQLAYSQGSKDAAMALATKNGKRGPIILPNGREV